MKRHKPLPNEALEFWLWILVSVAFFCVCYVAILYMKIKDAEVVKIDPTSQASQNSEAMRKEPPPMPRVSAQEQLPRPEPLREKASKVEARRKAQGKANFPCKSTWEPKLNHFAQKYLVEACKPNSNLQASKEESAAGGNHYSSRTSLRMKRGFLGSFNMFGKFWTITVEGIIRCWLPLSFGNCFFTSMPPRMTTSRNIQSGMNLC